jgi:hypothetical protein
MSASQPVPMIETNNVLTNPSGPEYQFLVGEGKSVHCRFSGTSNRVQFCPDPPRVVCAKGRSTSCYSPSTPLRGTGSESKSARDSASAGDRWNTTLIDQPRRRPTVARLLSDNFTV